ncbi:MAG TPA: DUF3261 domain-containing protein [Planctomycetota bacterium]
MSRPFRPSALMALALLTACASSPRRPWEDKDYPGTLQPAGVLTTDVLWQQRVTATWGEDGHRGFDAAVQKQGDVLTVIGLSPTGSAGYAMILRGMEIELKNDSGEELPFPPRFILLDVQRTFYPWLGAQPTDGTREADVFGEHVRETWRSGHLVERRFERLDAQPKGVITITYVWTDADAGRLAPRQVVLDNGWFGYRLVIDTHVESRLPPVQQAGQQAAQQSAQ